METIGFVFKSGRRLWVERVGRRRERGLGEMETIGFVFKSDRRLWVERISHRRAGGLGEMETIGFVFFSLAVAGGRSLRPSPSASPSC